MSSYAFTSEVEPHAHTVVYAQYLNLVFIFGWILLVLYNHLYQTNAFFVLIIPILLFSLSAFNAEDINEDIEADIYNVSFVTAGLILSLPLLGWMEKGNLSSQLSHVIVMAMIFTLMSYYHYWVSRENRHLAKLIRSNFETLAVTLYIFVLVSFFLRD